MYGWSETEALTMNVRDLMPETGREDALVSLRQLCQRGTLEPQRVVRKTKDGRTLTVSLVAAALVDKAGETYAIATTERDLTA
jgi:two-component system CheB/CheR fusion protein